MAKADIGLIGLAVMGENLILNMESKGFTVACFNRTVSKVDNFINGRAKGKNIIECKSIEELAGSLKRPRKLMMISKGQAVDDFIDKLLPHLDDGDIIIDDVNSSYSDAIRRCKKLKKMEILYIATCVYADEQGALQRQLVTPGWSPEAWEHIKPILQEIGAYSDDTRPDYNWVGKSAPSTFAKPLPNRAECQKNREGLVVNLHRKLLILLNKVLEFRIEKHREVTTTWTFSWHPRNG